jgi:hypothetical protein
LYEHELNPIEFDNNTHFSDAWINYLKHQNQLKSSFMIETQMIENMIRNPEKKLDCYSIVTLQEQQVDQLDIVIRECCQSFIYSPPRCVMTITFCLINLLQFAKKKCELKVKNFFFFSQCYINKPFFFIRFIRIISK